MRGRKRIISFFAVLSGMLIFSGVFASGVVDVSRILSSIVQPLSPGPGTEVSVYPANYFKDYTLQPVNSKFAVHVNVSDVSNLFSWQLNVTWNKDILNVTRIITGTNSTYILYQTTSENKTASYQLGFVINATNYDKGYSGATESILDNRGGAAGVSTVDWLRLVSIEFKVVGYGSCNITISTAGTLPATLLSNTRSAIAFTWTDGYFSNKYTGDINGDQFVDSLDFGIFAKVYGIGTGDPKYNKEADLNKDGNIDSLDFGVFAKNYGRP